MNTESATSTKTMDPISRWNHLDERVRNHVKEFNDGILEINDDDENELSFLKKRDKFIDLISRVSNHMREITDDFNTLHVELVRREKELSEQECCLIPTSISGAFYAISALSCCASAISSVGNILTFVGPTVTLRLTGLVIGLSADSCGFLSECAQNIYYMQKDEISRIARLNQAALENARKFQGFLNDLQSINEKQKRLLEALNRSGEVVNNEEVIDPGTNRLIDRMTRSCVKKYENFPEMFRRTGVCGRLVLQIIEGFPPNDPLSQGLKKLAEIEDIRDLPITIERMSYIGNLKHKKWTFEESAGRDSPSNQKLVYEPQHIIDYYKDEIQTRFGLDDFSIDITPAKSGKGFQIKIEDPKEDASMDSERIDSTPGAATFQTEKMNRE